MRHYDYYEDYILDRVDREHEAITNRLYPSKNKRKEKRYMAKNTIVFAKAILYWFKGVNKSQAVANYDGDGYEWTFEAEPEDITFLREHKLIDRLKDPMAYTNKLRKMGEDEKADNAEKYAEGRGDYLVIRKPTETKDGEPTEPFRILDEDNEPWDRDQLIGNGSKADLKLKIVDWGPSKKKSIYCMAVRVTDHVPYESDEFAAMDNEEQSEEKPKAKPKRSRAKKADSKGKSEELDELDDDIPF